MAEMRKNFVQNGGKRIFRCSRTRLMQLGGTCLSAEAHEYAQDVRSCTHCSDQQLQLTFPIIEDFALVEASYTVVRILQAFPRLRAAPDSFLENRQWVGYSSHHSKGVKKLINERQKMTIVLSLGDGCRVLLEPQAQFIRLLACPLKSHHVIQYSTIISLATPIARLNLCF